MAEPFLAEIRMAGFPFPPRGNALCDGQILPISQNQSLYSLLGINYGGDGQTTFGLPDLRGRTPLHAGGSPGQHGGAENVTLTAAEMPAHGHVASATSSAASSPVPAGKALADSGGLDHFAPYSGVDVVALRSGTCSSAGSNVAHDNMQPFLTVNFFIATQGLFPSRA